MTTIRQFLAKKIFENKWIFIDRWSFVHLALFFYFGTQFPNRFGLVIIGSIIFEVVENLVSKKVPFLRENMKDTLSDLFFNILGYYFGQNFGGF